MSLTHRKKYVLIIPDGAADSHRVDGKTPLARARTPYADFIAREGVSGLMQTLYEDLPKESLVAQLGMLGWDPHLYYPHGRASCELLALRDVHLGGGDLAFRANLVSMEGRLLVSYNAGYIRSQQAEPLVERLNRTLLEEFNEFELFHHSDFRNTLVLRGTGVKPESLLCPEPHESHGVEFDVDRLIAGTDAKSREVAGRLNQYLSRAARLLSSEKANMLFPWSSSGTFSLPSFKEHVGFEGRVGVVGAMDFLHGVSKAGGLEFFKVGNGRPDTDYRAKGEKVVELLSTGYEFVVCHINAPDEAAHMSDVTTKIESLELIDDFISRPIVEYFQRNLDELGGVMIAPDHYTNISNTGGNSRRMETHSAHAVPFALWDGRERDGAQAFNEDGALLGKFGKSPVSHLDLLSILRVQFS